MNKQFDIYGIGAALVDIELEVSDEFLKSHRIEKGQMTLVTPETQNAVLKDIESKQVKTTQASGGSAANTIFAAACFGSTNYYSCKTANDTAGQFFVEDMQQANITCTPNQTHCELPTGTCVVMVTPDAERTMNTYLAISESLSVEQINIDALRQSRYLYVEGYLATSDSGRAAAIEAKKIAQQNNCQTVLTFSDPAMVKFFKPQLDEMIGTGVDLLFCNEEEAMIWANTSTLSQTIEAIKPFCKQFAITRGAQGALVFDGKNFFDIPPCTVKAIDTNGAGDMFAGAFLYALNQGYSFEQAGILACKAAAKVVSQFGPRLARHQHKELLG